MINKISNNNILERIYLVLKEKFPNLSKNAIYGILLSKIAQILTSRRIQYKELEKTGIPNFYTIAFVPSGGGNKFARKI